MIAHTEISDSIRLMGLIIKTKPYTYSDNIVNCAFESHIDLDEIKALKKQLEDKLNGLPELEQLNTDEKRYHLQEDIYFLDQIIIELENN